MTENDGNIAEGTARRASRTSLVVLVVFALVIGWLAWRGAGREGVSPEAGPVLKAWQLLGGCPHQRDCTESTASQICAELGRAIGGERDVEVVQHTLSVGVDDSSLTCASEELFFGAYLDSSVWIQSVGDSAGGWWVDSEQRWGAYHVSVGGTTVRVPLCDAENGVTIIMEGLNQTASLNIAGESELFRVCSDRDTTDADLDEELTRLMSDLVGV